MALGDKSAVSQSEKAADQQRAGAQVFLINPVDAPKNLEAVELMLTYETIQPGNGSRVTEFILIGLTKEPALEVLLFILFLLVYTFALLGNGCILVIVWLSAQLHTPMYYFLTQLAFLDLGLSTDFSPKLLVDLLTEKRTITLYGCITQIFLLAAYGSTEYFLLAAMAFDRYAAICNPLQYTATMTKGLCRRLVVGSYIGGFLHSLIHAVCLYRLSFCGPDVINHFGCDYPVLLKLSCTDTSINDLVRYVFAAFVVLSSLLVTFVSYSYIVSTILKIGDSVGRRRAASTCISHFTCVFLFYGSGFLMEAQPTTNGSEEQSKVIGLIPTVIIPALNPLIYSLRNNEVKEAVKKILRSNFKRH
ncbi:olfactory receptor 5M5-like [Pleurodeles waltl]|uniref:olfactory receptor 5M5-like n=1 Tax=Pleurodeles waltl TaxID=8319 RepID=UPI0037099ACB